MEEQNEKLNVPTQPMTIVCKCECGEKKKVKIGVWGVFARVFAGMTGFVMSLFMPVFVLIFLFIILVAIGSSAGSGESGDGEAAYVTHYVYGVKKSENKLLQVPITGIILGDKSDGADLQSILSGGMTYGYEVKDILRWAAGEKDIKGVILAINSPGGTVVGAQAISDAVAEYRNGTKNPVYAHISGVGASGAYWSAASADKIYADYGSITGSIGVIMGSVMYYDTPVGYGNSFGESVETKNGIKEYGISAGKGKDFGNPFQAPTDEELAVYRKSVENEYVRFLTFVAERRGIDQQVIREQIGAYVYDNKEAENLRLLDGSQMKELTYAMVAKQVGVASDYQVVGLKGSGFLQQLFAMGKSMLPSAKIDVKEVLRASSFCAPKAVAVFHGDMGIYCR